MRPTTQDSDHTTCCSLLQAFAGPVSHAWRSGQAESNMLVSVSGGSGRPRERGQGPVDVLP